MRKCIATVIALLGRHIEWQKQAWISMSSYFKEKILTKLTGMLGGIEDPYAFNKGDSVKHDERLWPCVEYPDIYNYLVTTSSSYIYQRSTEGL